MGWFEPKITLLRSNCRKKRAIAMKTISLTEFHKNTEKWVRRAQGGEEVVVTVYGKPTASIRPVTKAEKEELSATLQTRARRT
jgi:prevent-host-death family protein